MGRTPIHATPRAAALLFLTLALAAAPAGAQVVINELLPNPSGDDVGTERIEIYNAGASPVNLTGWAIDDAATIDEVGVRCRIPEDFDTSVCSSSAIIGPGEFRVIKGTSTAAFLNNTNGDDVYLVSNRVLPAMVVHTVHYPDAGAKVDSVWAALPNGSVNFAWRTNSMCATNGTLGDITSPATVTNLAAAPGAYAGEIRLTWTAPGDDGATGTASAYIFKVGKVSLTGGTFDAVADLDRWIVEPLPGAGGSPETLFVFGLDPDSTYYFAMKTQDEVPNTSGISNSPGVAPFAGPLLDPDLGYTPYFGNLHSHTGYSDGVQTPTAAYNFARNTAPTPLDYLVVSDHNHSGAGMSLPSYAMGLGEAAAANDDGNFVAIYGQEWGFAADGHVNIFESPALFGWEAGNYDVFVAQTDYAGLYSAVLANPPASYPPLALWCHPATSDFNGMQVTANGQAVVRLMCLVNGPSQSTVTTESDVGNTGFDGAFQEALRKGMRVSPTADQDNHNATWGASSESRTAALATAKTKSQILGSLAVGRNYATQDHNARVDFSADGHTMGEDFSSATGIRIAVRVTDPDPLDSVAQIELYRGVTGSASPATRVAYSTGNSEFAWRELGTFAPLTEAHYYLRIRMADNQNIWTGPVFVTYDPATPLAVDERPASARLELAAHPNPALGRTVASFVLPRASSRARLSVYDAGGRRVRNLLDGPLAAGAHQAVWDGRTQDGALAPAGIFFLHLETGAESAARRVLLLR